MARALSDTFAGIAPGSVPMFAVAQLVGGALALALDRFLHPRHLPAGEPRTSIEVTL